MDVCPFSSHQWPLVMLPVPSSQSYGRSPRHGGEGRACTCRVASWDRQKRGRAPITPCHQVPQRPAPRHRRRSWQSGDLPASCAAGTAGCPLSGSRAVKCSFQQNIIKLLYYQSSKNKIPYGFINFSNWNRTVSQVTHQRLPDGNLRKFMFHNWLPDRVKARRA